MSAADLLSLAAPPAPTKATVRQLIVQRRLDTHFQPIVALADGRIEGFESLVRPRADCPWRGPDALFQAARAEAVTQELELECLRIALSRWLDGGGEHRLFVNLSAGALVALLSAFDLDKRIARLQSQGLRPGTLVIELTEHEHVRDVESLARAVGQLRRYRVALALDDFGDGRSSLRLWSELKPEIVKIDKYFTHDLEQHPEKLQTLRALIQISQTFGSMLVAEGIETEAELMLVRDLGIRFGQGWFLGRPQATLATQCSAPALQVIRSKDVAVFPERRRQQQQRASTWTLLREVPPVAPTTTTQELFERFQHAPSIGAVAVVDGGRPMGLVSRQHFVDLYVRPYFREVHGRKACTEFANLSPHVVELGAGLDDLIAVLTSDDQRYLSEGIIIAEHGQYRGLASGEDLVRVVTEARIEAARHANPLTLLPGNIPLTQHIERLLQSGRDFVACYGDLNHFKPFNDRYGYWRGDEMILAAARNLTHVADPLRDFVGHVGGDDFVVLFQSEDWLQRCEDATTTFNADARQLYDDEDRARLGIEAEDRHGTLRFFPFVTIAVGAVRVAAGSMLRRPEQVANAAARAKLQAKRSDRSLVQIDL